MTAHTRIEAERQNVDETPATSQKLPRRMLPQPLRRAVALAIELERTHDQLAAHIGHSIPLPDRIIVPGTTTSRRGRISLPRDLSGERIAEMHQERLEAIEALHTEIADTMGFGEADHLYDLVDEAHMIASSENFVRPTRNRAPGRSLDPDDRLSAEELMLAEIGRAADNPPPATPPLSEPTVKQDSIQRGIAIDLLVEGLISYHRISRAELYKAIDALRRPKRGRKLRTEPIIFATPMMRSNQYPTLHVFGEAFPKALFRLRGDTLETQKLEMIAADAVHPEDVWTYRATSTSNITLSRRGLLRWIPMHDMERRALTDLIDDPRFHRALVIDRADRYQGDGLAPLTSLRLRPAHAYLDPPGVDMHRHPIQRPTDIRKVGHGFRGAYEDLEYADTVLQELGKRGVQQRHRLDVIDGGGLALRLADPGRNVLSHRFEIKRETLHSGSEAIGARIDAILDFLKHGGRRKPIIASGATLTIPKPKPDLQARETKLERLIRLHGPSSADSWNACTRIDALLHDRLNNLDIEPDHDTEFHLQEGLLAVRSIRLVNDIRYRLERFDRVLGKIKHAIGILEIERSMSPASIEALRDGTASQIVPGLPSFGQAQVRRISKHDGMIMVTVRVPLHDRSEDPT